MANDYSKNSKTKNYKKTYNRDLQSVGSILTRFVNDYGIDKRLKERVILTLWPKLVGEAFSDCTRAVSVIKKYDHDVLMVAVSSAAINQELQFYKKDLLKKVMSVTSHLELNIRDMFFSHKIWKDFKNTAENTDEEEVFYVFKKTPTEAELNEVVVPDSILVSIRDSIHSQDFVAEEQKEKFYSAVIKDVKIQIWKKSNGFPCCKKCGVPINFYNPTKEKLCPSCLLNV